VNGEPDDYRDSFQQWVRPLLNQAAGYAYAIVGNHADAEDAVQESLWKAYRSLHGYDHRRPSKGWWFAIVRNCCLNLLGHRRSRPRTVPLEQAGRVAARAAPEADPLREALARLTPGHREILELRYIRGLLLTRPGRGPRHPGGDRDVAPARRPDGASGRLRKGP